MDTGFADVVRALDDYFDGFYEGNIEKLRRIFHPACHLFNAADGPLVDDDMDTVYARVAARRAPALDQQARQDRILSVDKSGPETALVKLQIAIGPKLFTDYLSLLKIEGRWQIISKTFTYVPIKAEQAKLQAAE